MGKLKDFILTTSKTTPTIRTATQHPPQSMHACTHTHHTHTFAHMPIVHIHTQDNTPACMHKYAPYTHANTHLYACTHTHHTYTLTFAHIIHVHFHTHTHHTYTLSTHSYTPYIYICIHLHPHVCEHTHLQAHAHKYHEHT